MLYRISKKSLECLAALYREAPKSFHPMIAESFLSWLCSEKGKLDASVVLPMQKRAREQRARFQLSSLRVIDGRKMPKRPDCVTRSHEDVRSGGKTVLQIAWALAVSFAVAAALADFLQYADLMGDVL